MSARKEMAEHVGARWVARAGAAAASLVLAGVALLGTAAPATAADEVLLSLDGASWSPTLAGAMFTSPARVVPGDVAVARLWVRNSSGVAARLTLHAVDGLGSGSADLAGNLTLRVDGAPISGGSTWRGPLLASGKQASVNLEVRFDAAATVGTLGVANVVDTVVLTQEASAEAPVLQVTDDDPVPTTSGSLAATGAEVRGLAGAALASVALGVLLIRRRRRAYTNDV